MRPRMARDRIVPMALPQERLFLRHAAMPPARSCGRAGGVEGITPVRGQRLPAQPLRIRS